MKQFYLLLVVLLVHSTLHTVLFADTLLGRTFDGRRVIIHSDGRIEYEEASPTQESSSFHQKRELIQIIVEISGFLNTLNSLPEQIKAQITQRQMTAKDPEIIQFVAETLVASFDPERSYKIVVDHMTQKLNRNTIESLLSWYESPLGKKIATEEQRFNAPGEQANLLRYIADLKTSPPPRERVLLIQEFEASAKITELIMQMTVSITRGMLHSLMKLAPPDETQPNPEEIEDMIQRQIFLMEDVFREQMLLSSLYVYRNISDEDMAEYITFVESPASRQFSVLSAEVLEYIIADIFDRTVPKLMEFAKKKRTK